METSKTREERKNPQSKGMSLLTTIVLIAALFL